MKQNKKYYYCVSL